MYGICKYLKQHADANAVNGLSNVLIGTFVICNYLNIYNIIIFGEKLNLKFMKIKINLYQYM